MNFLTRTYLKLFKQKRRAMENACFTGLIKDPSDSRDYKFGEILTPGTGLLKRINLKQYTSKVKQQGTANSCTAHAAILVWEISQRIKGRKENKDWVEGSESYAYKNGRIQAGLYPEDSGCYIRSVLKIMQTKGVCPERMNPYNDNNINAEPRPFADNIASMFKITNYTRLNSIIEIKNSLQNLKPVIIGTPIYKEFFDDREVKKGIPIPNKKNFPMGAHAYTIIGYDDDIGSFLIQNSWGQWGNEGFAWMPYDYIEKVSWFDAWNITI